MEDIKGHMSPIQRNRKPKYFLSLILLSFVSLCYKSKLKLKYWEKVIVFLANIWHFIKLCCSTPYFSSLRFPLWRNIRLKLAHDTFLIWALLTWKTPCKVFRNQPWYLQSEWTVLKFVDSYTGMTWLPDSTCPQRVSGRRHSTF